ncbi:MAG TPA: hypothetical protein VJZ50_02805, partial [Candidatus Limnocylindrales bacterium]|nr:hypothetical protein [Candidatus Limnocylindrales bacterium]
MTMLVSVTGAPASLAQSEAEAARAGDCAPESEPNDAPDQADATTGASCLGGTLPAGDQDLVVWELT